MFSGAQVPCLVLYSFYPAKFFNVVLGGFDGICSGEAVELGR